MGCNILTLDKNKNPANFSDYNIKSVTNVDGEPIESQTTTTQE